MSKEKIWAAILGSSLVAGITTAVVYFPDLKFILIALASLVTATTAYITGKEEE